jgi:bacteriocin-like protein
MERTNEKPIELTTKELDTVSGGVLTPSTKTLPRNTFPWPVDPRSLNQIPVWQ